MALRHAAALAALLLSCTALAAAEPKFGDDASDYAKDGECDDPRFGGPAMTDTTLLADDILHDATDCRAAFLKGGLSLRGVRPDGSPDFGDDEGQWAKDGECDDPRFEGPDMTDTALLADDILHDATDCRVGFERGELRLR